MLARLFDETKAVLNGYTGRMTGERPYGAAIPAPTDDPAVDHTVIEGRRSR